MKKAIYLLLVILLAGCTSLQIKTHQSKDIVGLASPVQLNTGNTVILLEDYFVDVSKIDSIKLNGKPISVSENGKKIIIKSEESFQKLMELEVYINKAPYQILCKKSEKINKTIRQLSKKYGAIIVNADSALNAESKTGIIGNDLMVDHLHPTLRGYQIIGKTFYEAMEKNNFLPKGKHHSWSDSKQDEITIEKFPFTSFDSTIAAFKIKLLKDDWPFINPMKKTPAEKLLKRNNYLDSLAYDFVMAKIDWEKAERLAADYFFAHKQFDKYVKQMNVLIWQFPIILSYYKFAAEKLIEAKQYDAAYNFVLRKFRIRKDYFSSKWLGIINLSRGKFNASIYYLKLSTKFKANDPQVYYNLAGAYTKKHDYKNALNNAKLALKYNPKYKQAEVLKSQLEKVLKNIKPKTIKITPKGKNNDK